MAELVNRGRFSFLNSEQGTVLFFNVIVGGWDYEEAEGETQISS